MDMTDKTGWIKTVPVGTTVPLRRAVKAVERQYRERIKSHFQLNDSRRMWQGLRTICSFGNKTSAEVRADPLLADELNSFYGRMN